MKNQKFQCAIALTWTLFQITLPEYSLAEVKPKYGSHAIPLSQSHDYFRGNSSPLFWKLIPYYVPQKSGSSCSVASVSMILNAARAGQPLGSEDSLVTEDQLLTSGENSEWKSSVQVRKVGVSLDQLGKIVERNLKYLGIPFVSVETVHFEVDSPEARQALHDALTQSDSTGKILILANFLQGIYTGDASIGHIAPIGAYDAKNHKALVLDPDRKWYEPYWVSLEILSKGMATVDSSANKKRGYVKIRLK